MGDDTNYDALFAPNNFFVFNLEDALPILQTTLIQYMGIFPIKGGKRPQTDGKRIFLPSSIDDFQDPKSDLHKNKNMSLYLSHLIHEMLHIREGSFFVDSRPFLEKFKNPSLAHRVFNIIEDARIEFNAREYLQPDHARIMLSSNNYLATDHNLRPGDA